MAARRRASATRKGKKADQQQILMIAGAVAAALLIAGVAYWLGHRNAQRHVIAHSAPAAKPAPTPKAPVTSSPKPAVPARATKPHFDFYTILPDVETVLPDKEPAKRAAVPGKPAKSDGGAGYVLQAASYGSYDEADRLKAKLVLSGFEARIEKVNLQGKGDFYRVRLGPYASVQELDAVDKRLAQQLGIHPLRLKLKRPEA